MSVRVFVFRLTELCDKRCPTCCCHNSNQSIAPFNLINLIKAIKDYSEVNSITPILCLTGGEVFLYRKSEAHSKKIWHLQDVIDLIRSYLPQSPIIIKTSGWDDHQVLDSKILEIQNSCDVSLLDIRLGFNLYQHDRTSPERRLRHMAEMILAHQEILRIETICDLDNVNITLDMIDRVLGDIGFPRLKLTELMPKLELGCRFTVRSQKNLILIDVMPAYNGLNNIKSHRFVDAINTNTCPNINEGPTTIMYDPSLNFYHCNDAYADYSLSGFSTQQFQTIQEQDSFLNFGFSQLKDHLQQNKINFSLRRERCKYCSRFFHDLLVKQ